MTDSLNLFDPGLRRDPHAVYARLRKQAGVSPVEPIGAWIVTRYDDVVEVLKHPELYSSDAMRAAMTQGRLASEDDDGPPPMVITTDPPNHTRLRGCSERWTSRTIDVLDDGALLFAPLASHTSRHVPGMSSGAQFGMADEIERLTDEFVAAYQARKEVAAATA